MTGLANLRQADLLRLSTARNTLFYDVIPLYPGDPADGPNYGIDIRDYLGDTLSASTGSQMATDSQLELAKDKRHQSVTCSATVNLKARSAQLFISAQTALGTFSTVLNVTQLQVS